MVVLAAAVLTKSGKSLLSRQFVEMSRIRIEGLLSAFPKLMGTGKQYTYFETDTVRYVYQPIETLFLVLITNRSSNIVEDLETLRLLGRIVPEFCSNLEEESVSKKAFDLLFAFDEVIQLGYRESLTLEQVNTFLEMDSHEERLAQAIKASKITDANTQANIRAKQLAKEKRHAPASGGGSSDVPLSPLEPSDKPTPPTVVAEADVPKAAASSSKRGGMVIGSKKTGKEDLLKKMMNTGELEEGAPRRAAAGPAASTPAHLASVHMEAIHLKLEEKINAVVNHDGGFQSLEVKGDMFLTVSDSSNAAVKVHLNKDHNADYAWKTHPNINKMAFTKDRVLSLKDPSKPFPVGSSLGILRWRLQNTSGFTIPLSVNCWPGDDSVSIEYELERDDLTLNNVTIAIPLGGLTPSVDSVDCGEHRFDAGDQMLYWVIDKIEADNSQGSMEFSLDSQTDPSTFFPISVNFFGESTLANVSLIDLYSSDTGLSVPYSSEIVLGVERYEIV
eukprot:TRINITY_DN8788_c0_g1_i1.p1 TRINITY_DN8788_c0_g1~~TRINITY_DN8788_c0_g1_i1.p1  ORF type:complete len:503 (+),score=91.17 TRINITY_DN8788_c0_g1_i1:53-1561(+)